MFSYLWNVLESDIVTFFEQANLHHHNIKFTADISDTETVFRRGYKYPKAQDSTKTLSLLLRH